MSCFLLVLQRLNSVKYNFYYIEKRNGILRKNKREGFEKSYVPLNGGRGVKNCQNYPYVINECSLSCLIHVDVLWCREPWFTQCEQSVDLQRYISVCTETACTCLQNSNSTEESCRCEALLNFVKQCSAADSSIDLSSWRIKYNCRKLCPFIFLSPIFVFNSLSLLSAECV